MRKLSPVVVIFVTIVVIIFIFSSNIKSINANNGQKFNTTSSIQPIRPASSLTHQLSPAPQRLVVVDNERGAIEGESSRVNNLAKWNKLVDESMDEIANRSFYKLISETNDKRRIVFDDTIVSKKALNERIIKEKMNIKTLGELKNDPEIHLALIYNQTTILVVRSANTYYYWQFGQTVGALIIFAMIVVGNLSILHRLKSCRRRRSNVNYFIVQLAIADLFVGLFSVTLDLILRRQKVFTYGPLACRASKYISVLFIYSSAYLLVALSIDRWEAVVKPLAFTQNRGRGYYLVGGAWLLALISALPVTLRTDIKEIEGLPQCWVQMDDLGWKLYMIYVTCSLLVIPALIIAICYTHIVYTIWTRGQPPLSKGRHQLARTTSSSASSSLEGGGCSGTFVDQSGNDDNDNNRHVASYARVSNAQHPLAVPDIGRKQEHRVELAVPPSDGVKDEQLSQIDTDYDYYMSTTDEDLDEEDEEEEEDEEGYGDEGAEDERDVETVVGTSTNKIELKMRAISPGQFNGNDDYTTNEDKHANHMVKVADSIGSCSVKGGSAADTATASAPAPANNLKNETNLEGQLQSDKEGSRDKKVGHINQEALVVRAKVRKRRRQDKLSGAKEVTNRRGNYVGRQHGSGVIPKARIKTIKMTLVIVVAYILCWSPFCIINLCSVFKLMNNDTNISVALRTLTQSLAHLNSAVNPIIFWLFSSRRNNTKTATQSSDTRASSRRSRRVVTRSPPTFCNFIKYTFCCKFGCCCFNSYIRGSKTITTDSRMFESTGTSATLASRRIADSTTGAATTM